jgi:hypothetical protein
MDKTFYKWENDNNKKKLKKKGDGCWERDLSLRFLDLLTHFLFLFRFAFLLHVWIAHFSITLGRNPSERQIDLAAATTATRERETH